MAGNLDTSNAESTWVLTSYLVSNAIVLPISGWLAGSFGRKRFFLPCITLFTASSMLCGAAPRLACCYLSYDSRAPATERLQPMAQAILADTYPPQKRGMAFALYGNTAEIVPTIGPTLDGWTTNSYSWHWIFYIHLPVGILALFSAYRLVEDPPYLKLSTTRGVHLDYIGIALLSLGVAGTPGGARQGPGGQLVPFSLDPGPGHYVGSRPGFAGHLCKLRAAYTKRSVRRPIP